MLHKKVFSIFRPLDIEKLQEFRNKVIEKANFQSIMRQNIVILLNLHQLFILIRTSN